MGGGGDPSWISEEPAVSVMGSIPGVSPVPGGATKFDTISIGGADKDTSDTGGATQIAVGVTQGTTDGGATQFDAISIGGADKDTTDSGGATRVTVDAGGTNQGALRDKKARVFS